MKTHRAALLASVAALASASAARAQAPDSTGLPTCDEIGAPRVAIMAPPGKTPDQMRQEVERGGLLPFGTQALILEPGQYTPMRNAERFGGRLHSMLRSLLDRGFQINGSVSMVLKLDESGNVVEVTPNSGNVEVDRTLTRAWREAKFEPYVIDGCRAVAWIQVPENFQSDWDVRERRVEVNSNPAPAPNP